MNLSPHLQASSDPTETVAVLPSEPEILAAEIPVTQQGADAGADAGHDEADHDNDEGKESKEGKAGEEEALVISPSVYGSEMAANSSPAMVQLRLTAPVLLAFLTVTMVYVSITATSWPQARERLPSPVSAAGMGLETATSVLLSATMPI